MDTDVIFLSYDEPGCEENWRRLKNRVPGALRVHGIEGIWNAHHACAQIASSKYFFLVDGDAEILDEFHFELPESSTEGLEKRIFLWRSINPVNDLVNGHGAIKLIPRCAFAEKAEGLDMTPCIEYQFVRVDVVASISRFNSSELSAWRGGFRECSKLAAKVLDKGTEWERKFRLQRWCTQGLDRPFGEWCIRGAIAGRNFGRQNRGNLKALELINDYHALEVMFKADLANFTPMDRVFSTG